MNIALVDLKRQYKGIKKELTLEMGKVMTNGDFILGKSVTDFEEKFAKFTGAKYSIGVASGSDALLIGLQAIGVKKGDEVITVANTFISTVLPIIALGAKPVLVDINPDTYQIDLEKLKKAITNKTKAILPVHLFGYPAPIKEIMKIAKAKKIFVVEDACQAHGAYLDQTHCGNFGTLGTFSFYPGKNLGAPGDGGAIITSSESLNKKIRILRNIGQTKKYKHDLIGYNSRLDTLHAAALLVKLKHLESWNEKRRNLAKLYTKLLSNLPIDLPPSPRVNFKPNFHLYVIRTKKRDQLIAYLNSRGVHCGIHYPIPVHLQKSLKNLIDYKNGDFKVTEKYAKEMISLPIFAELKPSEVKQICKLISQFFNKK